MSSPLLAALGATRTLLDAMRGRPNFAAVSATERAKLQAALLQSKGLADVELAQFAEGLKAARFAQEDEGALLDGLAA
eukprot:6613667-Alexandrium_andersonii.AAC.1